MVRTFAMSTGVILSGLPSLIQYHYQLNDIQSIKPLFLLYSILGLVVLLIYLNLSNKIEIERLNDNKDNKRKQKRITKNESKLTAKTNLLPIFKSLPYK